MTEVWLGVHILCYQVSPREIEPDEAHPVKPKHASDKESEKENHNDSIVVFKPC